MIQWIKEWAEVPARLKRVETMNEQIQAALQELDSAVGEVSTEMGNLAARVEQGDMSTGEVVEALRSQSRRLRDIRPDTPATEPVAQEPGDMPGGVADPDNNVDAPEQG